MQKLNINRTYILISYIKSVCLLRFIFPSGDETPKVSVAKAVAVLAPRPF